MALENERYVLALCNEALGVAGERQRTFDWLLGDESAKTGRRMPLPVDAYRPTLGLVVEFHEKQHTEAVAHFDKPHRMTVSGVHRGVQRRIYDDRRRDLMPKHGLTLVVIPISDFTVEGRFIVQDHKVDLAVVRIALNEVSEPSDRPLGA
ncbi:hypothetical protein [Frigoribacterium faeni]|uniref:hypothetical protein n=1 Tax=Frigoribacterium faeni TaxID=145483 RepID=UPI00141AAB9B|nr:hypothetical protein [Frigoribacterium faeni]NIJ04251.1 hypothetical protein [Frigoribacterium faeni]